jgi:aminomethyltransferase
MPVSFEGIVAEHECVRTAVGLFDVSHMGEIEITGADACAFADYVVSNNVEKLDAGRVCYSVCCNNDGRVLDDLLVYKYSSERILFVVNAVNTEKIHNHLNAVLEGAIEVESRTRFEEISAGDVTITNTSAGTAQIAVQGPRSRELLLSSDFFAPVRDKIKNLPYYSFFSFNYNNREILLSRTGYTGELGFEIYLPAGMALDLWNGLLDDGGDYGAKPIGLGARDTLRFEPAFCLYGHELSEEISPLEVGLSWVVKLNKGPFIGSAALAAERSAGPARTLIGLEMTERGIARRDHPVTREGGEVGRVTSGTFSPTLGKSLALAIVERPAPEDNALAVDIRGKSVPARRVPLPFYKSRSAE